MFQLQHRIEARNEERGREEREGEREKWYCCIEYSRIEEKKVNKI
jgi:hypothetical protein